MPLEIDRIDNKLNNKVFFSKTVELIAAVHMLADKNHHGFLPDWTKHVLEGLSSQSCEMLELMSGMNFPGLEIYDFVNRASIYQDIELLLQSILQVSELDFAYLALNEELSLTQLQMVKDNPREFHNVIERLSWAASGTEKALKAIVYDTKNYKTALVQLMREIYSLGFEEEIAKVQELYTDAMENVRHRLEHKNPIELAQEIKGTKVTEKRDYKEYVFTPSYFLHHHNIISYSGDRFMLIYNINIHNTDISAEAERIANLLKVLSEKSRLEILKQLKRRPTYGKVLSARLNLTTATISRHLEQLRAINLIREEKKDSVKYFRVNSEEFNKLLEDIKRFVNGQ